MALDPGVLFVFLIFLKYFFIDTVHDCYKDTKKNFNLLVDATSFVNNNYC